MELFATLRHVSYIRYLVWVHKNREKVKTVTMAITVWITRTVTIAIYDGFNNHNSHNDHDKLQLSNKLAIIWFFQETIHWLILVWFFTFSCADIQFAESLSGRLIQLPTTKRVKFFSAKEFMIVALSIYDKALWCRCHQSGTWSWRTKVSPS